MDGSIVAINYKDSKENALRFLGELGNPYHAIGVDPSGKAAIDWGVYGIPESYLVAPDATILYKRVGPFDDLSLKEGLFPAMEKAGLSISLIIHPPGAIDRKTS